MKPTVVAGVISAAVASVALAQGLFPLANSPPSSATQLARGRDAYALECLNCHGATLDGTQFGPALKGAVFESHFRQSTRAEFSERIRTTMPPGKLGTLSSGMLADIEAYVLQPDSAAGMVAAGVAVSPAPTPPPAPGAARGAAAASSSSSAPARPPANEGAAMMGPGQRRDNDPQYLAATQARRDKLSRMAPVTDAVLRSPSSGDWLMWRRTYDGLGFSPLRQMTRSNVAGMRSAWSWVLPPSGNQITPLVYDGVMFIGSGAAVHALDAANGDLLWQYSRPSAGAAAVGASHGRSMAIYGDKVFAVMPDGQLAALDFRTGKLLWSQNLNGSGPTGGFSVSGGPIVAKGVVMIGVSLGVSSPGGCYILGLDADSGQERWRFHTVARPGQPGGETWNGAPVEERFGAGVWTVGSYDPELDLAFFGTGNTYNTAALLEPRPGSSSVTNNDALYTNSTVALRPDTGELVWHFQHHKRDVWDMDWVFEQTLVTLPVQGRPRKLVVTGGKLAIFEAMDAATGQFIFAKDIGLQNMIVAIDPKTGAKTVNPAVLPEAGKPKLICPNSIGARNWTATATNPESNVLFVPLLENCADYTYAPRDAAQTARGGLDMRFSARAPDGHDGKFGRMAALDLKEQKVLWVTRQREPYISAALATAGGLVFAGDVNRNFFAYDQRSGETLWSTRLSASAESYPVSYSVNGRQYVAVVTGGGSPWGSSSRGFTPEVTAPAAGVSVTAFELPR